MKVKVTTYTTPDGARASYTSFALTDSTFDVLCLPGLADDGQTRCLPFGQASMQPSFFFNATCSQKVVMVYGPCTSAPTLAVESVVSMTCQPARQKFYLGTASVPTALYQKDAMGACTALPQATVDSYVKDWKFYAVGTAVPASDFSLITTTETTL